MVRDEARNRTNTLPPMSSNLNVIERIWANVYGTHSSYGIRLCKSGMISLRTTTLALRLSTLRPEDARRSLMPVACGQGIRSICFFF